MTIERFLRRRSLSPQTHSLLHYKVDIFSFLTVVLDMYCSTSERFLICGRVIRLFSSYPLRGNFIFLKKYHSNIFIFIVIQRFLRIGLVIRQKNFFILYPLRGNFIFLKFYRSDTLVFMMIESFLIIELVGLVNFLFLSH